jgi:hypothetical protein
MSLCITNSNISLILALALITAACGSNDTATPAQSTASASSAATTVRDACSLIAIEEAAKILGSPAKATPGRSSAERSTCDYVTEGYEAFTLEATWKGGEEEIASARRAAQIAETAIGGAGDQVVGQVMGLQKVANLGDEAYFSRRAMSYVRKGDVLLTFQNAGLNEPAREHWEALARAALARLQ